MIVRGAPILSEDGAATDYPDVDRLLRLVYLKEDSS